MPGLTSAERRGALVLAVLLALGTLSDLWRARHPHVESLTPPAATPAAEPAASEAPSATPSATSAAPEALDLNHATVAELDALPGIGPVLAARIVEHRRRNGPFRDVDELLAVPGIGPRLLERLRPALRRLPA